MHTLSMHHIVCHTATHLATQQVVYAILQGKFRVLYDDRDDEEERLPEGDPRWHFIDSPVPARLKEKVQASPNGIFTFKEQGCRISLRCHPTSS